MCRDLAERVVFGEEAADGLAVDLARGEVDETLAVLGAVLDLRRTTGWGMIGGSKTLSRSGMRERTYHWECVDEVAVDGVERPRVVVRGRADRRQVYRLGAQIRGSGSRSRSRSRGEGKPNRQSAEGGGGMTTTIIIRKRPRNGNAVNLSIYLRKQASERASDQTQPTRSAILMRPSSLESFLMLRRWKEIRPARCGGGAGSTRWRILSQ